MTTEEHGYLDIEERLELAEDRASLTEALLAAVWEWIEADDVVDCPTDGHKEGVRRAQISLATVLGFNRGRLRRHDK